MIHSLILFFKKTILLPELLTRVTVGWVFVQSGWGKFGHLDKVTGFFESLGIPMASVQAPMVAGLELVCGALLILGFLTELVSIPLVVIMIVALKTAKAAEIVSFSDLFGMSEFLYIVLLLWLIAHGPGRISIDRHWTLRRNGR